MIENYNRFAFAHVAQFRTESESPSGAPMDLNLHSLPRHLIELRMAHADLDNLIDQAVLTLPDDELSLRRLKKRRLQLRDQIAQLEAELDPPEPA